VGMVVLLLLLLVGFWKGVLFLSWSRPSLCKVQSSLSVSSSLVNVDIVLLDRCGRGQGSPLVSTKWSSPALTDRSTCAPQTAVMYTVAGTYVSCRSLSLNGFSPWVELTAFLASSLAWLSRAAKKDL